MINLCVLENDNSWIIDLVKLIVPFLLGLFSSLLIDKLRDYHKNKRIKKFVNHYLKESILNDLPKLIESYELINNKIENYSDDPITIPIFEGFDTNVLNGIEPVVYYEIFKEKYTVVNEIISIIDFLSKNLPLKLNKDYYSEINGHLKEVNKVGDLNHIQNCDYCKSRKEYILGVLDLRISETHKLKKKILKLIK